MAMLLNELLVVIFYVFGSVGNLGGTILTVSTIIYNNTLKWRQSNLAKWKIVSLGEAFFISFIQLEILFTNGFNV